MKKNLLLLTGAFTAVALLAGCDPSGPQSGVHTYRTFLSTNPTLWNTHTWETNDEAYITSFTEMGLYDLVFNENRDGYAFMPEMAAAEPVSVDPTTLSDEEFDLFLEADIGNPTRGMIWDIALNEAACFEDGTAINAKTYVDSMERLLNPQYANYRADSYYSGELVLLNAEDYYKSGRETIEAAFDHVNKTTGAVESGNGIWYINLGQATPYFNALFTGEQGAGNFYSVLNNRSQDSTDAVELAAERITYGVAYYLYQFVYTPGSSELANSPDKADWEAFYEDGFRPDQVSSTMFENDKTYIDLMEFDNKEVYTTVNKGNTSWNDENTVRYTQADLKRDLSTFIGGVTPSYRNSAWNWELPLFTQISHDLSGLTQEDLGIKAIDDYTIRLYLTKPITSLNLRFALTGNWIVDVALYDRLTQTGANNTKFTTYGSNSVDNYRSYGPYKLTHYESGNQINISRNDKWYGYTDGRHEGMYEMDAIVTRIIPDHNTALQEFLAGNLDDIDLTSQDMARYGSSSRRTTTYESYTQKISFNSDRPTLLRRQNDSGNGGNINKTILANTDFRRGLSLAINRTSFAAQTTGGSRAFTGLLNDLYIANNADGTSYRSTPQGKSVYAAVYGDLGGETIGSGEALAESAYGYNNALAVEYVAKALRDEVASSAEGHFRSGDTIDIEFRVYDNESETTIGMFNFLNQAWTEVLQEAAAKAGVQASLNFHTVTDQDYYTSATSGRYDLIFSIWGGATIDPYGLMEVYCAADFPNNCEYGFKGRQNLATLDIDSDGDGVAETKTFDEWYHLMTEGINEAQYGDDPAEMDETTYQQWQAAHEQRLNILAGLEIGILNRFEAVPIVARGTSSLMSYKWENGSETYVNLIGYGGVRYMEANMDDVEWANFVAQQGGNLSSLYVR